MKPIKAVILDLDGVITRTADVHATAWKEMFDEFLSSRQEGGEDLRPFELPADYLEYVDGKPRYDGVRSFLASRGIELPEGSSEDDPSAETVRGLGNRKNARFLELIESNGVTVFPDAAEQISRWRESSKRTAVVSSSRNCGEILDAADARDWFEVQVDGNDVERCGLPGKPAPDMFLKAAEELGVRPDEAVVLEDAGVGVQAGRRGSFAMVVGVARHGDEEMLRRQGADRVVHELTELEGEF